MRVFNLKHHAFELNETKRELHYVWHFTKLWKITFWLLSGLNC